VYNKIEKRREKKNVEKNVDGIFTAKLVFFFTANLHAYRITEVKNNAKKSEKDSILQSKIKILLFS
jgi:hypothetical protein